MGAQSASQAGEGERTARPRREACLAAALVLALARRAPELVSLLDHDPRCEAAWTAVADLALLASVLERDVPVIGRPLHEALRASLPSLLGRAHELGPGPQHWAAHAAAAWVEPETERERLRDPRSRAAVEVSRGVVLQLGPAWRPEEVAHVAFRLGATRNPPPLRQVELAAPGGSPYELTHVAFFGTDFGAVQPAGSATPGESKRAPAREAAEDERPSERSGEAVAAQLVEKAAAALGLLARGDWRQDDWIYDLGAELLLATHCLTGAWPAESLPWITAIMPERAERTLETLEREPGALLRLYHLMAVTALGLARAAAPPCRPGCKGEESP